MLRLLADENFDHDLVRSAMRRRAGLDLVRAQSVGLSETDDADGHRPSHDRAHLVQIYSLRDAGKARWPENQAGRIVVLTVLGEREGLPNSP